MSKHRLIGVIAACTLAALTGCTSGPNEQDTTFLDQLGEPHTSSQAPALIGAARAVCDRTAAVTDMDGFIDAQISIRRDFPDAVNRPGVGILGFEDAATSAYCPDVAAGLQGKLQAGMDAAIEDSQERGRQVQAELDAAEPPVMAPMGNGEPPVVLGGDPDLLVIPEECIGYGCSNEQDAALNEGERAANGGN